MNSDPALIGARFVHEGALLIAFGLACFSLYAAPGRADIPGLARWRRTVLAALAALAFLAGVVWLALTAADMSGVASDAVDPKAWAGLVGDTDFGKLWIARLAGCILLAAAAWTLDGSIAVPLLAGLVLASLAGTGHAGLPEGPLGAIHRAADTAHLLAAGLWIGALWALAWMVARHPRAAETANALRRFSGVGQATVAVLVATGTINVFGVLAGPSALLTTGYGRLLDIKLAAFAGMLCLAALNRFVLAPRLATGEAGQALRRLKWQILGEQTLAAVVVGVVAVIGTLDPGA